MISIRPDEISDIIRKQIEEYDQSVKVNNVGTVYKLVMVLHVSMVLILPWLVNY
jgi:F0F1-type ATP synthase alpha subunit